MNKFHKTAMARKNFSTPVQYLLKEGLLHGQMLDYGCGRGGDVERLTEAGYRIMGYDPNGKYNESYVLRQRYDIVISNYVLNVIENEELRLEVENAIIGRLHNGGTAYISVRNDKYVANGCTSTGTWQGLVEPVNEGWELVTSNSKFKMWKFTR